MNIKIPSTIFVFNIFILTGCIERGELPLLDGRNPEYLEILEMAEYREELIDELWFSEEIDITEWRDSENERMCIPGQSWCEGDILWKCNINGDLENTLCDLGCSDVESAHCREIIPSNIDSTSLLCMEGVGVLIWSPEFSRVRFDTDSGRIDVVDENGNSLETIRNEGKGILNGISFETIPQIDGPMLGVFSFMSLYIPEGVFVYGTGNNALVILSCNEVIVEGRLSVDAIRIINGTDVIQRPGPGGYDSGNGPGRGGDGRNSELQDGGGGGGGFGGEGGNGNGASGFGEGGLVYGNELLIPLTGGSGGGRGSGNEGSNYGLGGSGGGALQITSRERIVVNGIISSSGLGGRGGGVFSPSAGAGGGGGSGGGILLEALVVEITGVVSVNGGGGGGGGSIWGGRPGEDGENGLPSEQEAHGGASGGQYGCRGGNGNSSININGETYNCTEMNGGGGGGGAGRIRINALTYTAGILSPSPSTSPTSTTFGIPNIM